MITYMSDRIFLFAISKYIPFNLTVSFASIYTNIPDIHV